MKRTILVISCMHSTYHEIAIMTIMVYLSYILAKVCFAKIGTWHLARIGRSMFWVSG
jgi:hypothetical protein